MYLILIYHYNNMELILIGFASYRKLNRQFFCFIGCILILVEFYSTQV